MMVCKLCKRQCKIIITAHKKLGDDINLKELVEELKPITDWFSFGTHLGVHQAKLLAIGKNYDKEGPERCKIETLIRWMKQEPPTWDKIVQALLKTGMGVLAQKIAKNHGMCSC